VADPARVAAAREDDGGMVAHWLFAPYPADDAPTRLGTLLGRVSLGVALVSVFEGVVALASALSGEGLGIFLISLGFGLFVGDPLPGLLFCISPRLVGGFPSRSLRNRLPGQPLMNRLRAVPGEASWRLLALYFVWLGWWAALFLWLLGLLQHEPFRGSSWGGIAVVVCFLLATTPPWIVRVWKWHARHGRREH
jgi:hypothetical protein